MGRRPRSVAAGLRRGGGAREPQRGLVELREQLVLELLECAPLRGREQQVLEGLAALL